VVVAAAVAAAVAEDQCSNCIIPSIHPPIHPSIHPFSHQQRLQHSFGGGIGLMAQPHHIWWCWSEATADASGNRSCMTHASVGCHHDKHHESIRCMVPSLNCCRLTLPARVTSLGVFNCQVSCALWVLGEYSGTREEVEAVLEAIQEGLGPLPLLALESGGHGPGGVRGSPVSDVITAGCGGLVWLFGARAAVVLEAAVPQQQRYHTGEAPCGSTAAAAASGVRGAAPLPLCGEGVTPPPPPEPLRGRGGEKGWLGGATRAERGAGPGQG
jgi:hypothetical protein